MVVKMEQNGATILVVVFIQVLIQLGKQSTNTRVLVLVAIIGYLIVKTTPGVCCADGEWSYSNEDWTKFWCSTSPPPAWQVRRRRKYS
jgi:hypothetical protein